MPKHRPNLTRHKITVFTPSDTGRSKRETVYLKDIFAKNSKKEIKEPAKLAAFEAEHSSTSAPLPTCTSHAARKHQECSSWIKQRTAVQQAFFESCSFNPPCTLCGEENGELLPCQDCGPQIVYCLDCIKKAHDERNLLHKPKIIVGGILQDYPLKSYLKRRDHFCDTRSRKNIQVFDEKGRIHDCWLVTCLCEPESVTLIRLQLWPTSPDQPRVAFHFGLMDLFHYMMVEGHLSLQAACQSLRWKNALKQHEATLLYRNVVGECFEEYRFFKHQCQNLNAVADESLTCPACPKENGDMFISLDGNFGLVRKRSSGVSYVEPKHSGKIFASQSDVDLYVGSYRDSNATDTHDCSNFQAGDVLRAKNKTNKLDTTGVFGAACRHGYPLCFLNLRHGERLAYAAFVIDRILGISPTSVNVHIIYDIACKLAAHFKKDTNNRHQDLELALPVFHAYGHKMACQVEYSTRWRCGYGLTDGEVMERLWSYLRRFASITKQMTPAHREDLLTDALLHYSRRKGHDIGISLVTLMDRAVKVNGDSKNALQEICNDFSVSLDDIKKWRKGEKSQAEVKQSSQKGQVSWQEKYVKKLLHYDKRRELMTLCDDDRRAEVLAGQCQQLETELRRVETKHAIPQRWTTDNPQYVTHHTATRKKQQIATIKKIWTCAVEYSFFLNMSRKYSEGQAVATRLSKQVKKSSKNVRKSVIEYNAEKFGASTTTYREAVDLSSELYMNLTPTSEDHPLVPSSSKRKAVDLLNLFDRSNEETLLVKAEMQQTLQSVSADHQTFEFILKDLKSDDSEQSKGLCMLVGSRLIDIKSHYSKLISIFSKHITAQELAPCYQTVISPAFDSYPKDCYTTEQSNIISSDDESEDEEDFE